jgi:DNA-binding NarL/FixJ family response regulator
MPLHARLSPRRNAAGIADSSRLIQQQTPDGFPCEAGYLAGLIPAMTTIRILLIDDHAMFRAGLRMVLERDLRGAEFFEAGSLNDAFECAPDNVDVVLLDIHLNGLNGLDCIALLNRKWPLVPVLMLSSQDAPEIIELALARGAADFVSKAATPDNMIAAINRVLLGEFSASPAQKPVQPATRLTTRQLEVLNLLHQGHSNKTIARQLALSENTVRRHVQDILEFFGVANRSEAVFAAQRRGLVS